MVSFAVPCGRVLFLPGQFDQHSRKSNRQGFNLNGDSRDVHAKIADLQYMFGNTRTGEALSFLRANIFNRAREGASKVVIVLTDGESQDEVKAAASKLIGDKAFLFAVGIGDTVNRQQLQDIAGLKEYLFEIANYNAIEGQFKLSFDV